MKLIFATFLMCLLFGTGVSAESPSFWQGSLSGNKGHVKVLTETDTFVVTACVNADAFSGDYKIRLDSYKKGSSSAKNHGTQKVEKNAYHTYRFAGAEPNTVYDKLRITVYDKDGNVYAGTETTALQTEKKYKTMNLAEAKVALSKASKNFQSVEVVVPLKYYNNGRTDADLLEEYAHNPKYCKNALIYEIINKEAEGSRYVTKKIGTVTIGGKSYQIIQMNFNVNKTKTAAETHRMAKAVLKKLRPKLSGKTPQEKVYLFMDYLAATTEYRTGYKGQNTSSAYCCFKYGKAMCGGYADALTYLCTLENIFCLTGDANGHIWNYIAINGKLYACDATWADPMLLTGTNKTADRGYWMKGTGDKKFYSSSGHRMTSKLRATLTKYYPLASQSLKVPKAKSKTTKTVKKLKTKSKMTKKINTKKKQSTKKKTKFKSKNKISTKKKTATKKKPATRKNVAKKKKKKKKIKSKQKKQIKKRKPRR